MKTKLSLFLQTTSSQITSKALVFSALILSATMVPAHAAKFGVRVVDDNGRPVAGASVCVGLQGNYKQFGATFTDARGQVMIEVPNVPLMVTVSKDRFSGVRSMEPARSFNLIKQVKLRTGVPGPRCRAGSVLAEHKPGIPDIVVTDIAIQEGPFSTTLSPTVSGEPNQYRVSDTEEFEGAQWRDFSSQIALAANLSDTDRVYLQMRKFRGTSAASLESRSEVLTVRLTN